MSAKKAARKAAKRAAPDAEAAGTEQNGAVTVTPNNVAAAGYRLPQHMYDAQHPADTIEDAAPPMKAVITPDANKSVAPGENK